MNITQGHPRFCQTPIFMLLYYSVLCALVQVFLPEAKLATFESSFSFSQIKLIPEFYQFYPCHNPHSHLMILL